MVRRRQGSDRGITVLEVSIGAAIGMVGLVLTISVLTTAQRSQRTATELSALTNEARIALTRTADEVRRARWITGVGPDAELWLDTNDDRIEQSSERITYRIVSGSGTNRLERVSTSGTQLIAVGMSSGTITVTDGSRGPRLTIELTFPGVDARNPTTLRTEVASRGNG